MPFLGLSLPVALTGITAGQHATNYAAIQALLNGGLKNDNLASDAAIAASKLNGYPADATKVLKGDGSWAALGASIGTSLPASPSEGQEYILVDSLTAPTYAWRFIYVSGIADANKWVANGPTPLAAQVEANETTGSTGSYIALTTAGPAVTVPRAGIYVVTIEATIYTVTSQTEGRASYDIGATGAVDADSIQGNSAAGSEISAARSKQQTIAAAATALTMKYKSVGASGSYGSRRISVIPVRVA